MKNFDEFVNLWREETEDIKVKKETSHLLFLVVYPDKLEWDFSVEKQVQTTTLHVSGGITGGGVGHYVDFCYRNEVNTFLKETECTHAMIVSVGMVFDMTQNKDGKSITPITDFYDFVESGDYCKGHIMARPDKDAFLHHQHINLNIDLWKKISCPPLDERWEKYERSDNNHHDDYTPFWIKPKDRLLINNFNHSERERKSFSYYKSEYNDIWRNFDLAEEDDFYFSRFMTRIKKQFYVNNNEELHVLPEHQFDIIFSPAAGYITETIVNRLNHTGEVVFYDYCQENVDIKEQIVEMNMSREEINYYLKTIDHNIIDNHKKSHIIQRIEGMGNFEMQRKYQREMLENCDIDYILMDLINPDYNMIEERVQGKSVFFNMSNIFSYHMSHAFYTFYELTSSWYNLMNTLNCAKKCYINGTKPTKLRVRTWI
jgi:hypothetical protein|tara:strand:+ start:93 stop:1379 length:1287 start_codon:yes stop_codon:yes gene_type:complete